MKTRSNKESAIGFLKLTASGKVDEAYSKYVAPHCKHHNPYFKGDRLSLMTAMKENAVKMPNKVFEIKLAIEEGDTVMAYSKVVVQNTDLEFATFHALRFENGLIAELWDLAQPIAKDSPNENGLF